jgi:phosphoglycerate dehydrogenase-like enzyme
MSPEEKRLVWLPHDLDGLDGLPEGLRYDWVDTDGGLPDGAEEVRLQVMPYRFSDRDGELFPRLPNLEVVQTLSAGVEHIRSFVPEGVTLCNAGGLHDTSTAELALTLVLSSLRGVPEFVRAQDRSAWEPVKRESLADKQVLVVGYGRIGAAIEERLLPFECTVTRVARSARDGVHAIEDLPRLLPGADVVIVIVPGTAETVGLFDAGMLARLKDGALLVNVARGTVVETEALHAELTSGRLRAALDVVDPEPLPADHPLWGAPNLLLLPHVGGTSSAMDPRGRRLVREQLQRYAAGEPLANVVTGAY